MRCEDDSRSARSGFSTERPRWWRRPGRLVGVDGITRWRELIGAGVAPAEVQRWVRDGRLTPVRRGAYLDRALPAELDRRHLVRLRAVLPQMAADAVVSHVSAALWHGIDIWDVPLDRVHVTRSRRSGARRGYGVHCACRPARSRRDRGEPRCRRHRRGPDGGRSRPIGAPRAGGRRGRRRAAPRPGHGRRACCGPRPLRAAARQPRRAPGRRLRRRAQRERRAVPQPGRDGPRRPSGTGPAVGGV